MLQSIFTPYHSPAMLSLSASFLSHTLSLSLSHSLALSVCLSLSLRLSVDASLLADSFTFTGPLVGPLSKEVFLGAFTGISKLLSSLEGLDYQYRDVRPCPFDVNRVWYTSSPTAVYPPTGVCVCVRERVCLYVCVCVHLSMSMCPFYLRTHVESKMRNLHFEMLGLL